MSPTPVVIAVDAMGGDHAPGEIVAGACAACRPGSLEIVLVGDEAAIHDAHAGDLPDGVSVRHAPDAIGFAEEPVQAVRTKPQSSLVVAAGAVRDGWAHAALSAGSTGAMLAASLLAMRRIPGVIRPGLAAVLPGVQGPVVLIDAGANVDCKPEQLQQFAHMGATFAEDALGVERPLVGLLTIGEEPGKGNALARESYELLAADQGLRFFGNVEGRDLLDHEVTVFVVDGFTGNITLKTAEGVAKTTLGLVREAALSSLRGRIGGLLLRPGVRDVRERFDSETYGGAFLLGLSGVSVVAHGSSSRKAIANACRYAALGVERDVTGHIAARIGRARPA